MVISYETDSFRRRFIFEGENLIQGRSFLKEGERGEVYRGKVLKRVGNLGYFVDLGPFKGLCQEKLNSGDIQLFEIIKRQVDKEPLLTSKVGFMGESLILQDGPGIYYSKSIPSSYRRLLEELKLEGVYFRREASRLPLHLVKKEYDSLRAKKKALQNKNQLGLVYSPPFKEEGDPFYFMELEEKILHLRRGKSKKDGITLFFEPTRAGLVIDVNGVGKEEDINRKAGEMIEESLILMNVGGLVIIDLLGRGRGYRGEGSLTKEGIFVKSLPVRGANLFYVPLEKLKNDYKKLRNKLSEEYE
ncbi:MAG TPA: hypothetical protein VFD08_04945 [Clostridia bacterium]|nr:hypothetical protein [Clostridia bacterium]